MIGPFYLSVNVSLCKIVSNTILRLFPAKKQDIFGNEGTCKNREAIALAVFNILRFTVKCIS